MKKLILTVLVCSLVGLLVPPPALVAAGSALPSPAKIVLGNGLTVYFLRNADLPLVSFRMVIRG
ncbi:MAG: hypothetical protein ACXW3H_02735, partial [Candidatus Aminicenantales bacterium]